MAHSSRIKKFRDRNIEITESVKKTIIHNSPPHFEKITQILDLSFNEQTKSYEICCKWRGFNNEEPTWEPFNIINEDVPEMLSTLLDAFPDQDLVKAAKQYSSNT